MEFQKHFFSDLGETIYHGISAKGLPVYVIKKTGYAESYAPRIPAVVLYY